MRETKVPGGVWPVLPTPFLESGEVDYPALVNLTEFYVSAKVFDLTPEDRLKTTKTVVDVAAGRCSVVSAGNFGATLADQAAGLTEMFATGVDEAVVLLSNLPSGEGLGKQLVELAGLTTAPLGIYECPLPKHWLLSPEDLKAAASTGLACPYWPLSVPIAMCQLPSDHGGVQSRSRLAAAPQGLCHLRNTIVSPAARDNVVFEARLAAVSGTPMVMFQANLRCTPKSLALGAHGHCGFIANVCPELLRKLIDMRPALGSQDAAQIECFNQLVAIHDLMAKDSWPSSCKYVLSKRGVPMTTYVKAEGKRIGKERCQVIDEFLDAFSFAKLQPGHPAVPWMADAPPKPPQA
eukprot:gene6656-1189_t